MRKWRVLVSVSCVCLRRKADVWGNCSNGRAYSDITLAHVASCVWLGLCVVCVCVKRQVDCKKNIAPIPLLPNGCPWGSSNINLCLTQQSIVHIIVAINIPTQAPCEHYSSTDILYPVAFSLLINSNMATGSYSRGRGGNIICGCVWWRLWRVMTLKRLVVVGMAVGLGMVFCGKWKERGDMLVVVWWRLETCVYSQLLYMKGKNIQSSVQCACVCIVMCGGSRQAWHIIGEWWVGGCVRIQWAGSACNIPVSSEAWYSMTQCV